MIGFLGMGLMGQPLAKKLVSAKLPTVVYNRTLSKLEPLRQMGGLETRFMQI